jgi:uncharacterized protein (TIGR02594 family)
MNRDLIDKALDEYGNTEIPGDENNPEIMKYYHETGREWVDSENTPWCDAFMDWVALKAGARPTEGLNARAWLNEGNPVKNPQRGDLVILWRESIDSWKGHVGLFIRESDKSVWILGGNQQNSVRISAYRKNRVLGYRRLKRKNPDTGTHQSFR